MASDRGFGRLIVVTCGVAAVIALGVLSMLPRGRVDYSIPMGIGAIGAYAVIAAITIWRARQNARSRSWLIAATCAAAVLMAGAALSVVQWQRGAIWPPRPERSRLGQWSRLSADERAQWASRVAAHALTADTGSPKLEAVILDSTWMFPPGARVAMVPHTIGIEVWAMSDGAVDCVFVPLAAATAACSKPPEQRAFRELVRGQRRASRPLTRLPLSAWPQYRGDAERHGAGFGNGEAGEWTAAIAGPIRSAVSVSGGLVLAGTHGTGVLGAFDLRTGRQVWTALVPNWIHQDPVSDGEVVLVGFGDNLASFDGGAPAGVAAYDLQTGQNLWTVFDESSVMTSPAIDGTGAIYATAAGVVYRRSLRDGSEEARATLPGGVVMGPPALSGQTVVFAVDNHFVCALGTKDLAQRWCTPFPGVREIGSSPAITAGRVLVAGGVMLRGTTWDDLVRIDWARRFAMIRGAFDWTTRYAGQKLFAIDLETGKVEWASRLYQATRVVHGHDSGTPTISGSVGVVVMPISDTIVAFDVPTGKTLWTAGARGGRGPPIIVEQEVVSAGRDGVIEVRRLATGEITCTVRRSIGFDRTGPAVAGGAMVFANLNGGIEAISTNRIRGCRP